MIFVSLSLKNIVGYEFSGNWKRNSIADFDKSSFILWGFIRIDDEVVFIESNGSVFFVFIKILYFYIVHGVPKCLCRDKMNHPLQ